MKKCIIILALSTLLAGCGKGPSDYVKSLELSDKSFTIETDDLDYIEATVKTEGNASTEITAVSSDESLVAIEVYPDEEEPGLNYVDFESFEGTGEAEITVTTVGNGKNDKPISEKFTVKVVESLEE
ncbi:MAG TPA: hypothetical protein DCL38_10915 [Lachnospiraceae bacterium]|nr:hypothetical protein [Lachnospiraceae bacterium]